MTSMSYDEYSEQGTEGGSGDEWSSGEGAASESSPSEGVWMTGEAGMTPDGGGTEWSSGESAGSAWSSGGSAGSEWSSNESVWLTGEAGMNAGETGEYATMSHPGERWDTAPAIDAGLEAAWDWVVDEVTDSWNSLSGGTDGGGGGGGAPGWDDSGGEGAPPYSPGSGGPTDGGSVPDVQYCAQGPCPTCDFERQMTVACVLESAHYGDHQCAFGDSFA
jgi:hypothetical protein